MPDLNGISRILLGIDTLSYFSDYDEPLTLTYWTWYDIERDYDYLYLLASLDGEKWDMLNTPSGTMIDPTGNNFGQAYNGMSGGSGKARWIQEQVDLERDFS